MERWNAFLDSLVTPGGRLLVTLFLLLLMVFINNVVREVDDKIKYLILGWLGGFLTKETEGRGRTLK